MAALAEQYGEAATLEDFERKAQLMDYVSYRAIFEGFQAHLWTRNSGRLLWMTHPSWPSNTWQIYSSDYDTDAAYYAVKKACEPVHAQLNLPDFTLSVANISRVARPALSLRTRIVSLDNRLLAERVDSLDVAPNSVATLAPLDLESLLTREALVLVKLTLTDSQGAILSANLYGQGRVPPRRAVSLSAGPGSQTTPSRCQPHDWPVQCVWVDTETRLDARRYDIDLRSDTVTRPSPGMRAAMADAAVGDDVYGDDPTVNRLQASIAERFGFESALFFASGTQSNLAALMAHCGRGDEYLVGQEAHTYSYEGGGAAVLGSIQPQPLENEPDGGISLERIAKAIKPRDIHFAPTRLLALENTIGGRVLPPAYQRQVTEFAHSKGLVTHLDGARIFNAIVKLQIDERAAVAGFDSVWGCPSPGPGAPPPPALPGSPETTGDAAA